MFYVSSIKGSKIGVTDTSDGIEEFFSDKQVVDMLKNKINIFGTSLWNNSSNAKILDIDQVGSVGVLKSMIAKVRKTHNNWTLRDLANYLASLQKGTVIRIEYLYTGSYGESISSKTTLQRLDYDNWLYEDEESTFSGMKGDSDFAAWAVDVATCGRVLSIKIK